MASISALTIVMAVLMCLAGGKRGIAAFGSVALNFILMFIAIILISAGFAPIWVALFVGIAILAITIYLGNDDEQTARIAFIATLIVLCVMIVLIVPLDHFAQIKGFSNEQTDEIEQFTLLVGVNFESITIATTLLSTLGAISEAAIAIASGLREVIEQNPGISVAAVRRSGRNIGFQIMGMTFNTLFFGMFGGDLALFVLLYKLKATFGYYLNSKIFVSECMMVLYSAIAVILVIWITTQMMARKVKQAAQREEQAKPKRPNIHPD